MLVNLVKLRKRNGMEIGERKILRNLPRISCGYVKWCCLKSDARKQIWECVDFEPENAPPKFQRPWWPATLLTRRGNRGEKIKQFFSLILGRKIIIGFQNKAKLIYKNKHCYADICSKRLLTNGSNGCQLIS